MNDGCMAEKGLYTFEMPRYSSRFQAHNHKKCTTNFPTCKCQKLPPLVASHSDWYPVSGSLKTDLSKSFKREFWWFISPLCNLAWKLHKGHSPVCEHCAMTLPVFHLCNGPVDRWLTGDGIIAPFHHLSYAHFYNGTRVRSLIMRHFKLGTCIQPAENTDCDCLQMTGQSKTWRLLLYGPVVQVFHCVHNYLHT